VISSDPSCKDGNALFTTTIPLKGLSDQVYIRYQSLRFGKQIIFNPGFSTAGKIEIN